MSLRLKDTSPFSTRGVCVRPAETVQALVVNSDASLFIVLVQLQSSMPGEQLLTAYI